MLIAAGDILELDMMLLAPVVVAPMGTAMGALVRDSLVRGARTRLARADLGLAAAQVVACLVAGVCAGLGEIGSAFLVAGFAGGLSTWSSLAVDAAGWWRARRWGLLAFHLVLVLGLSMSAFVGGRVLAGDAS